VCWVRLDASGATVSQGVLGTQSALIL